MLELLLPILFLGIALFVMVRGSGLFVQGAESIGIRWGFSPFVVGVVIVGFGTSFPELFSAFFAIGKGTTEMVTAHAVGSNISNILLIGALFSILGGYIAIKRNMVRRELPVFFLTLALFVIALQDGVVDRMEGVLFIGTFVAYMLYLFFESKFRGHEAMTRVCQTPKDRVEALIFTLFGLVALLIGAKYAVDMSVLITGTMGIPAGLISMTVIAIGTTLPEFFVMLHSLRIGNPEIVIGNIFGTIAFNTLVVIGLPSLFVPLVVDEVVLQIGLPVLIAGATLFMIQSLVGRMARVEGIIALLLYAFFIYKLAVFCALCLTAG